MQMFLQPILEGSRQSPPHQRQDHLELGQKTTQTGRKTLNTCLFQSSGEL
jgi:hypothetical protein